MLEKTFQTQFNKFVKSSFKHTAAYELKVCKTALPFSAVKEHQLQGLWHAKHDGLVWKIVDCGYQNPFDAVSLYSVEAYIVIRYASGNFYMIDIDTFLQEQQTSIRKSLTEERCKQIAIVI